MQTQLMYVASVLTDKVVSSWPWYMTRSTGVVAAILAAILLLSGIGMLTGLTYRFLEPLTAWSAHRAVGIAFVTTLMMHVFSLLFDKFVGFSILDLFIPFKTSYQPAHIGGWQAGSLYIAFGIIAMYLTIAIVVTSLLWVNKKPKLWRIVHYMSYITLIAIFFHGLFSGTDFKGGVVRAIWIGGGVILAFAVIRRLLMAGTIMGGKKP